MDFNRRILPFYMTASNDILMARDDTAVQDLEYFQKLYPRKDKHPALQHQGEPGHETTDHQPYLNTDPADRAVPAAVPHRQ